MIYSKRRQRPMIYGVSIDVKIAFLFGTIEEEVYVDDIIFGSTKKELCTEFEKLMHDKFQISFYGELTCFMGLPVKQKEDGIFISQDKYVAKILRKFSFTDVKTTSTPMDTDKPLLKDLDGDDVDVHLYRSMIGSLMYLTSSRPDIIDSPFDLVAYSDSDYAGASLDKKSTTGGCQFLGTEWWFDSLEVDSQVFDSQENDKYKTKDEYVFSELVTSIPDVATSEAKTSESKPKFVGEPLIEDWISDSEDENEMEMLLTAELRPKQKVIDQSLQTQWCIHMKLIKDLTYVDAHQIQEISLPLRYDEMNGGLVAMKEIPKESSKKKTVSSQEYILLPLLTSDQSLSKGSKDSPDEWISKPQGSTNNINTASDGNSTNNVNTVSSTVNAASLEDNATYENTVYGCDDDPIMPNLEEIAYSIDDECGFEDPEFPNKVYKVEKALYGLHQAPRAWYETLSTYLLENGFRRGTIDKTLFIKKDKGDILLTNKALLKDEEDADVDAHLYRSMIRSLMYITTSRPDIMFAVYACASILEIHHLTTLSDSDYAGASLDRKSTTRGCQFLKRRLITSQCKKQTIVANSITEAEYVAPANCCGHMRLSLSSVKDRMRKMAPHCFSLERQSKTVDRGPSIHNPNESHSTPIITQPSSSKPQKKNSRRKQRKENGPTEPVTDEATNEEHLSTPSYDPPQSGEDRLQLTELMSLCTSLQEKVLNLEKAKTAQLTAMRLPSLKEEKSTDWKRERIKNFRAQEFLRKVGFSYRLNQGGASICIYTNSFFLTSITTSTSKRQRQGKMVEPEKPLKKKDQITLDEELALRLHVEEQAELEKERVAQEEASKVTTIEELDSIQAMIEADEQLATRLQAKEQEQFSIEEKSRMLVVMIAERKKFFAA
ncbi:uncharacterized mitochondrial protein-like protein [Tanacetum coccineum]|uniref:Uncharacterized mitochondrial protein-like protein n=1 Tax=Tanacetum coccineum TaxID=301880 RepID=A0ABQ4ZBC4_9ASTR